MNGSRVLEERLIWSDRTIPDDSPAAVRADVVAGSPCSDLTTGLSR
jgi:hypothetical protein